VGPELGEQPAVRVTGDGDVVDGATADGGALDGGGGDGVAGGRGRGVLDAARAPGDRVPVRGAGHGDCDAGDREQGRPGRAAVPVEHLRPDRGVRGHGTGRHRAHGHAERAGRGVAGEELADGVLRDGQG
jgi:hypothetical protein